MAPVSYVDATAGAVEQCDSLSAEFPPLADKYFIPLKHACQNKLWHQLTLLVHDLVYDPATAQYYCGSGSTGANDGTGVHLYLRVYDKIVSAVESKLNPLSLAVIASQVSASLVAEPTATTTSSSAIASGGAAHQQHHQDWTAAKAILENLLEKLQSAPPQSSALSSSRVSSSTPTLETQQVILYVQCNHALLLLKEKLLLAQSSATNITKDDLADVAQIVKSTAEKLSTLDSAGGGGGGGGGSPTIDPRVYASHYELGWHYYKVVGPPEAFCRAALSFVQYQPPTSPTTTITGKSTLKVEDWLELGVDLCWAALTGEGIYGNLYHVVTVVTDLIPHDHPQRILVPLLQAVADGDVSECHTLWPQVLQVQPSGTALPKQWSDKVVEKVSLMALIQLVFDKSSHERVLTFAEISERLQLPMDQVEWIVMRACSVKIVTATIDEVDQTVLIQRVLPRRLQHPEALRALAARYGTWATHVQQMHTSMQSNWNHNDPATQNATSSQDGAATTMTANA